jgi:PAS domain S-box-containing protein
VCEVDLPPSVEALLQENAALQAQCEALQAQLRAQEAEAKAWLQRRNEELLQEAQAQEKNEALQGVLYRIAERAAAGLSFYELLQTVHGLVGELLYAKNFFVCLVNTEKETLRFPYYVDERDGPESMELSDVPMRRGMCEFVLRSRAPQHITAQRFVALQDSGDITEATGDLSFHEWLGVPMQLYGKVGGVLVVQSYSAEGGYSTEDVHILQFVANHVSSAIERYQALEAVRVSEQRYRTVIENVGVGVVVAQGDRIVFANPVMEQITGHSIQSLLTNSTAMLLTPEDMAIMLERQRKRMAGEPTEKTYELRIITKTGEPRTLELSATLIEWNKQPASLLFVVDVTNRLDAENDQRLALQKQIELNDIKTRFINMASHEFRTPLASIHGSVELLMHYGDRMPPDKHRNMLVKIDEAVQRMTHMLENVLVIGRTDAGQLQFQPHAVPLAPFCRGLAEELRNAMGETHHNVNLLLELPPDEAAWMLDDVLLRTIIGNLLSNAVKYSPQGGDVLLRVQAQGDQLHFEVQDHGIGIPEEDLPHMFQSFHRASNVGPIAGTGLGLSIVKEAVTCHDGTISVLSEVGTGTCFTVILPAISPEQ